MEWKLLICIVWLAALASRWRNLAARRRIHISLTQGIFFVSLATSLFAQTGRDEAIRVSPRLVVARTSVIASDGGFVHGLISKDFRVFDNSRLQQSHVETFYEPVSLVVAVQTNAAVRQYVPQFRKVGSVVETLIVGEGGEAAIVTFGDDVRVLQSFTRDGRLLIQQFRSISLSGRKSKAVDAIMRGSEMLAGRHPRRRKILLLISQQSDAGSEARLAAAISKVEAADIRVFSLVIPRLSGGRSGFLASLDLMKLIPEIFRASKSAAGVDPLSVLTAYTGGRQLPFRSLHELEIALTRLGEELHSEYSISFVPEDRTPGYHQLRIELARPDGAVVHTRAGYYRGE